MSQRVRVLDGRDRGATPEASTTQLVIGACGSKINPRALDRHLPRCGQCLTWWVSNHAHKRKRGE